MSLTVPVSTRLALPDPLTLTVPVLAAVSEPLATPRVTVTLALPASTSVMPRPASLTEVSSLVLKLVSARRSLLDHLKKSDADRYQKLIETLGLRR